MSESLQVWNRSDRHSDHHIQSGSAHNTVLLTCDLGGVFRGGSKLWTNFESIRDRDDDYFCFQKQCHTCDRLVRLINLNDDKTLVSYETWWKEQQKKQRHAETRAQQ